MGAKNMSIIGTKWQSVTGRDTFLFLEILATFFLMITPLIFRLASISVGQAGVWGISPKNEVDNSISSKALSYVAGDVPRWHF